MSHFEDLNNLREECNRLQEENQRMKEAIRVLLLNCHGPRLIRAKDLNTLATFLDGMKK